MIIYGGIDEKDNVLNDIHYLELTNLKWFKVTIKAPLPYLANHASSLVLAQEKRNHNKLFIYKYPDLPHGMVNYRVSPFITILDKGRRDLHFRRNE